jgi:hypothetical protein
MFDWGNTCCKGNQEYGFCSRATDVCPAHIGCAYVPAVACGGSDPRVRMKGKRLLWNDPVVFQACVLGLPCKVKFDSESSASHDD